MPWKSGAGQCTGEAEAVEQSKSKSNDPGMSNREAGLATPRAHNFRAEEENAESNGGIQRKNRNVGIAESCNRQRDAVGYGKRSHGLQEHPAVLDDQQETKHEEHVIGAEKNMPDALHDVGAGYAYPSLRSSNFHPGLRRMHDGRQLPAVKQLNAHQHVGDGQLQSRKLDALARQAGWSCINPPPLHEGVREFL